MIRSFFSRQFYSSVAKNKEKVDFSQLHHASKIPNLPVVNDFKTSDEDIRIDVKTIQLLERLALVNLDGEGALKTLRSSIQFAKRIENIRTDNKKPLYTVLENLPLHLRDDQVNEGNCREDILKNAKLVEDDYFISPPGNIPLKQN
ncbi:hypothetical protein DOY81_001546 [Sarcophaga bullata]|nr:hypothetical protein DOY81_001546 [Sarcophaga bullata]